MSIGGAPSKDATGHLTAHGMAGVPGVFFNYEISPMLVVHQETRQSFAHFLTSFVHFFFYFFFFFFVCLFVASFDINGMIFLPFFFLGVGQDDGDRRWSLDTLPDP